MNFFDMTVSYPTVFAVENKYCIAVPVNYDCFCSVEIGGKVIFDHANGVKRIDTRVHLIYVEMKLLDDAKRYTVHLTQVFSKGHDDNMVVGGEFQQSFDFYPVEKDKKINILQIADSHSYVDDAIRAKNYYGEDLSLLVLNGDLSSVSDFFSTFRELFTISGEIARGEKPCIFSRGNHDVRGKMAEKYDQYLPTANGKTYFTTNIGDICFIVLDCGEDKVDSHIEYHGAICCEQFRAEETEFINSLKTMENVKNAKKKVVICHIPFPHIEMHPFDIETETYQKWVDELNEIGISFYLCGHIHKFFVEGKDSEYNDLGAESTIIVGSALERNTNKYTACAVTVDDDDFTVNKVEC